MIIARCIPQDMKNDKYIHSITEKIFKFAFRDNEEFLKKQNILPGSVVPYFHRNDYIYNLITHKKFCHLPMKKYLKSALTEMKNHAKNNDINNIFIFYEKKIIPSDEPFEEIINNIFYKSGIDIKLINTFNSLDEDE